MSDTAPLSGSLPWVIAWRFLRGRGSGLLGGTARAALLATALGVMALVIAMALMTGYREDLQVKLIGDNAAVGLYPHSGGELDEALLEEIRALPGVVGVASVSYGQGLLAGADPQGATGVTLRGVDPGRNGSATVDRLGTHRLSVPTEGLPAVVLGAELARRLEVEEGDVVRLTALGFGGRRAKFRYQSLRVTGLFATGFSQFDRSWAVLDRQLVDRLSGRSGSGPYEIAVDDPRRATEVAERVRALVGPDYLVTDWRDLNRELFSALRLQKWGLFFALGLIVLVSTFNVASTMVVLVRERMRDIGALGAMGLPPKRLRAVFVLYGAFLGAAGTALGLALGSAICWVLTTFEVIRFEPEIAAIYFIDSVPFRLRLLDLAAIVALALTLTLLACLLPARKAASIEPSAALRYQ